MDRKHTSWKKSRKFGDIHGGRERLKLSDNIFKRAHSLSKPGINDDVPILIEENPSRDYFFPISVHEALDAVNSLPQKDTHGITHIWLRRIKKGHKSGRVSPLAEFTCGRGVRAIILYPWRKDMVQYFGPKKPNQMALSEYQRFCKSKLVKKDSGWCLQWDIDALRKYCIHVLYHEVGHHVDWYFRHWSKANSRQVEDFADQYAFHKGATARYVFNRLEKSREKNA